MSVKFYSEQPHITDLYPLVPAREYKREWVRDCAVAHKKYDKVIDHRANNRTAAKCPGMRNMMEAGYIVRSWFDFTIETDAARPFDYQAYFPETLDKPLREIGWTTDDLIGHFNTKMTPLKIPTYNYHKIILKIYVPWTIEVPASMGLQILPVTLDDSPSLTAVPGMFTQGLYTHFNIHAYWHETNGRVFVPAGTPLAQLIPVTVGEISTEDMTEEKKHERDVTFLKNRNKF